ncbi:phosphoribosyltransferase domain-containing protein [Streptomyces sp. NPDC001185]|uniref:phosphoribosyltransferase n=1 Tax=Streptomyces sp. NPDC001185 TaxID=3154380 RepID=UPI00331738DC
MSTPSLWRREHLLVLGWAETGVALARLAEEIRDSGFRPTVVVGITRGGLPAAVALSNLLDIEDFRMLGIPRNTSNSRYSKRGQPFLDFVAPDRPMTGADVLIVDDIMGDGGTMSLAVDTVRMLGAARVRTAVLVRNVHAAGRPDHLALEADDWIVFPWEKPPQEGERSVTAPLPDAR